jgi:hypothetical protein
MLDLLQAHIAHHGLMVGFLLPLSAPVWAAVGWIIWRGGR